MLNTLKTYYDNYAEAAQKARNKSNFFDNFLGLGSAANKHPCHEQFYEDIQAFMAQYVATTPTAEEACQMSVYMLEEPQKYLGKDAYWFMYVVVGSIRDLIPFMTKEDCAMLAEKLNSNYKKRDRMPVQEDTYKKLVKASK